MKGGINFEEWKEIVKKNRRSLRSKSNIYRTEPESLTWNSGQLPPRNKKDYEIKRSIFPDWSDMFPQVDASKIEMYDDTTNTKIGEMDINGGEIEPAINPQHLYRFKLIYSNTLPEDTLVRDLIMTGESIIERDVIYLTDSDFIITKQPCKLWIEYFNGEWTIGRVKIYTSDWGEDPWAHWEDEYYATGDFLNKASYMNDIRKNAAVEIGAECYIYSDGTSYKIKNVVDDTDATSNSVEASNNNFDIIVAKGLGQIPNLGREIVGLIDPDKIGRSLNYINYEFYL